MPIQEREHIARPLEIPLDPYPIKGDVYSWGRIARLRTESAFLDVYYGESGDDILAVDLCSSYPYFSEMMNGRHKQIIKKQAGAVAGTLIQNIDMPPQKNKLESIRILDRDTRINLRNNLAPKDSLPRQLLTASIFDIMVNPPPINERGVESVSAILLEKFLHSDTCLENIFEPHGKPRDKGNWVFIAPVKKELTLSEILQPILEDKTSEFLKEISLYLGKHLAEGGKLRKVTFASLDIALFKDLVDNAKKGFPEKLQNTLFFQSVQKTDTYIRANIRYLHFRKNSIGFFSSIEGWPYYGASFGLEGNIDIARRLSEQLILGGKAVFFPWSMHTDNAETRLCLEKVEGEWRKSGLEIQKEDFTRNEILAEMTDRELVLAQHSPVFQEENILTSLTLSKPNA